MGRMLALRYLSLLALVVWLGGLLVTGTIVAPATFETLQAGHAEGNRRLAGAVFGEVLKRMHRVGYAAGAVMILTFAARALLGPPPVAFRIRIGIVSAMLAGSLYSAVSLTPRIEQAQREIGGSVATLPESDPRRIVFGRLHRLSTLMMGTTILAGLVLLYLEASDSEH